METDPVAEEPAQRSMALNGLTMAKQLLDTLPVELVSDASAALEGIAAARQLITGTEVSMLNGLTMAKEILETVPIEAPDLQATMAGLSMAKELLETRALQNETDASSALRDLDVVQRLLDTLPRDPDVDAALRGLALTRELLKTTPVDLEAASAALEGALSGLTLAQQLLETRPFRGLDEDVATGLRGLALARQLLDTIAIKVPKGGEDAGSKKGPSLTKTGYFDEADEAALIAFVRYFGTYRHPPAQYSHKSCAFW
jgi:hypothetical protein